LPFPPRAAPREKKKRGSPGRAVPDPAGKRKKKGGAERAEVKGRQFARGTSAGNQEKKKKGNEKECLRKPYNRVEKKKKKKRKRERQVPYSHPRGKKKICSPHEDARKKKGLVSRLV